MADALDKIRKLKALALRNPNAEEARSAALKVCQLLDEHGVVLSLPARAQTVQREWYEPQRESDIWQAYQYTVQRAEQIRQEQKAKARGDLFRTWKPDYQP